VRNRGGKEAPIILRAEIVERITEIKSQKTHSGNELGCHEDEAGGRMGPLYGSNEVNCSGARELIYKDVDSAWS
jgi:hypothetical protein